MTSVELERIAREIVPPVGASMAIAVVDESLKHRAAFLVDGRRKSEPVGPAFDKPRQAIRLVDLLNGESPAPRSAPHSDLARGAMGAAAASSDEGAAPSEASAPGGASPSLCVGCGGPIPPGSRRDRRTCSDGCRQRAARGQGEAFELVADEDTGDTLVTPTRPS